VIGMAQRKKKVVSRRAMQRVCARTTRVWRRRWNGTERGAKWMLREERISRIGGGVGRCVDLLALFPAFAGFSSAEEFRGLSSMMGDVLLLLVVVWQPDASQVLAIMVLKPLDDDFGAFLLLLAIHSQRTAFLMHLFRGASRSIIFALTNILSWRTLIALWLCI